MSMRSAAIVPVGLLGLPLLCAISNGCRNTTRGDPGSAQNLDCGVVSDDKPVAVRASLPGAQTEQRAVVDRKDARAESVPQLDDSRSARLFGYRWADLPDDTGLHLTDHVAECGATSPLFEYAQVGGAPGHTYSALRVDKAGQVYRIRSSRHIKATCHQVGFIDSARWDAMKSLGQDAARAEMVRVISGPDQADYRSGHVIRFFGAPDSSFQGAIIAAAEDGADIRRRAGAATDIIVPWMLQLWRTSPWPWGFFK